MLCNIVYICWINSCDSILLCLSFNYIFSKQYSSLCCNLIGARHQCLEVVSALCFCMDLRPVKRHPQGDSELPKGRQRAVVSAVRIGVALNFQATTVRSSQFLWVLVFLKDSGSSSSFQDVLSMRRTTTSSCLSDVWEVFLWGHKGELNNKTTSSDELFGCVKFISASRSFIARKSANTKYIKTKSSTSTSLSNLNHHQQVSQTGHQSLKPSPGFRSRPSSPTTSSRRSDQQNSTKNWTVWKLEWKTRAETQ